jgi:hypothetical protein
MPAMRWTQKTLVLAFLVLVSPAQAQSAIEHHAWQDRALFEPFSRTATAITGAIVLWGNPAFAEPGSTMRMTFEAGPSVDLVSAGAFWREWGLSGGKQTAEVFRVSEDPGELLNGNTLCGPDQATHAVFFEDLAPGGGLLLHLAVFSGKDAPADINSDGLCGTFNYEIQ